MPDPSSRPVTAPIPLDDLVSRHLDRAAAGHGRSAQTLYGGADSTLRQTLIVLTAGTTLAEHENPGEATVYVLAGHVRLAAGAESWEGHSHDLLVVPQARHSLVAVEASAVLLSVGKRS